MICYMLAIQNSLFLKCARVLKVIENAVRWATPVTRPEVTRGNVKPLEDILDI